MEQGSLFLLASRPDLLESLEDLLDQLREESQFARLLFEIRDGVHNGPCLPERRRMGGKILIANLQKKEVRIRLTRGHHSV